MTLVGLAARNALRNRFRAILTQEVPDPLVHDPNRAIRGDGLAKEMNWKVGDKISLVSGIYPQRSLGGTPNPGSSWEFKIDGIYIAKARSVDRSTFLFHWKYLN